MIFKDRSDVVVVAVADADPQGLEKAAVRIGARAKYLDYREMLAKERPQLVCVSPRHADQHHAMGLAALRAGAHLYMEKPITPTLEEADELLSEAGKRGLKITVAHQMRLASNVQQLNQSIQSGLLGELLEMRAFGKQDNRAGGEDLMVLGVHLFDLFRLFAGDPLWCSARVTTQGVDITARDGHSVKDNVGLVAGDEVVAQFAFPRGVNASYHSRAKLRDFSGNWGVELIGSKGAARIKADIPPEIYLKPYAPWKTEARPETWQRWEDASNHAGTLKGFDEANTRLVDDWLQAIAENRDPVCSGYNAMKALEMIMAIYHSAITAQRSAFPLNTRKHPLG